MEQFKALLSRRVAGVPVGMLFILGVLGLVLYLRHKRSQQGQGGQDQASTQTGTQVFPNAYPMAFSSDVFVVQQSPTGPPPAPAPGPTSPPWGPVYPSRRQVANSPAEAGDHALFTAIKPRRPL